MKVIHVNDTTEVNGGVGVFIRETLPILRSLGIETGWWAIRRQGGEVVVSSRDGTPDWHGSISALSRSPMGEFIGGDTVIDVHTLSEPAILAQLFTMAPVVRHMHDQRFFCPGQGKFWSRTETICTRPFGLHCLVHAYTQRCCNRHPQRLWHQYANTRYEVEEASTRYAVMIANSRYTKAEAVQVGFPKDKITVLNNFTDATPEPDWDAATPPLVAFAGRLSRTKGVHVLLDAFAQVLSDMPEARLDILGSGHHEQAFFRQADRLALGDAVQFLGWADKATIDAHLSHAAVVAFPSIYPEAFGITGIEAMMRGKPVVAFDVGGVSDWLRHEETGLFATKVDADSLAAALLRLLKDDDLRRTLGRQARTMAVRDFAGQPHVGSLVRLYEKALEA